MKTGWIEAGRVRNTHALRGEVKFECFLEGENPLQNLKKLYPFPKEEGGLKIISVRRQADVFLVAFEGIDSLEKAAVWKGKTFYASRKELDPSDETIYFADLIGQPLIEAKDGTVYGTITEVGSRGAGELFTIRLTDGRERYFPVVKEFIVSFSAENGVVVRAPEGIFD